MIVSLKKKKAQGQLYLLPLSVLCRYRPCNGLIPTERILPKCLKGFRVSDVINSDSEQTRGPNP
jgi:hypothetical protein